MAYRRMKTPTEDSRTLTRANRLAFVGRTASRTYLGFRPVAAVLTTVLLLLACNGKSDSAVEAPKRAKIALENSAAYRGTIGEHSWFEGLRLMRVRGYGLVAGLGTNGSSDCPPQVRRDLIQTMYKSPAFSGAQGQRLSVTPAQIIDDLDTAVVAVQGEIPAAATAGTRFGVTVEALPGTQTRSLEGGRLYTCQLSMFRTIDASSSIPGKNLARAAGPVFINPFAGEDSSVSEVNLRRGYLLGGGITSEDRRVHLILGMPSYQRARAIMRRINERFPATPKIADALSPAKIRIRIPKEYDDNPAHFLGIVRHLYFSTEQMFIEQRLQALAEEMRSEEAPLAEICLSFEGIGRTAWATLRQLYAGPQDEITYYAAVAGVRTGDDLAVEVLARHARTADSLYQLPAIAALGSSVRVRRVSGPLLALLDDEDPRIRVAAYEALRSRHDPAIRSVVVGEDNFLLDRVPSSGPNLIYAKRTGTPRVALFGDQITCEPPVFYRHRDESITINALASDTELTLIRRSPFSGAVSPPLSSGTAIADLLEMLGQDPKITADGDVFGLGLSYSTVVSTLYELCEQGTINAKFMLEQPSVTAIFGPIRNAGRPESER